MWVLVQRRVHFGTFIMSLLIFFFIYLLTIFMQDNSVQLQAGLNAGLLLKARSRKYTWQRKNRFSRKVSAGKLELSRNGTGT